MSPLAPGGRTTAHVHHHPRTKERPGALAVDFANTVACSSCRVSDALSSAEQWSRWTNARKDLPKSRLRSHDLRFLRRLRADLRALLSACTTGNRPDFHALATINSIHRRAAHRLVLDWRPGSWIVTHETANSGPLDEIAGPVVRSFTDLVGGSERRRLKSCLGQGCAHFLLARTRQQVWCSPTGCGNRARAARHYRRVTET